MTFFPFQIHSRWAESWKTSSSGDFQRSQHLFLGYCWFHVHILWKHAFSSCGFTKWSVHPFRWHHRIARCLQGTKLRYWRKLTQQSTLFYLIFPDNARFTLSTFFWRWAHLVSFLQLSIAASKKPSGKQHAKSLPLFSISCAKKFRPSRLVHRKETSAKSPPALMLKRKLEPAKVDSMVHAVLFTIGGNNRRCLYGCVWITETKQWPSHRGNCQHGSGSAVRCPNGFQNTTPSRTENEAADWVTYWILCCR